MKIKISIVTFCFLLTSYAYSLGFKAGKHYQILDKPVAKITSSDKIEVREFFWYYCPHCANIEPALKHWLKTKPKNVSFVHQPAVFSKRWLTGARFYYTLKELNLLDKLHGKVFHAIHKNNIRFAKKQDFVDWLALNGADKQKAQKALNSFAINTEVSKARIATKASGVRGVPAFMIDGKYTTSIAEAGSEQHLFAVIDYLVQKTTNDSAK